jgi:hypothetical protein
MSGKKKKQVPLPPTPPPEAPPPPKSWWAKKTDFWRSLSLEGKFAVVGLPIAFLTFVAAALVVPEVRHVLHLPKESQPTPVPAGPSIDKGKPAQTAPEKDAPDKKPPEMKPIPAHPIKEKELFIYRAQKNIYDPLDPNHSNQTLGEGQDAHASEAAADPNVWNFPTDAAALQRGEAIILPAKKVLPHLMDVRSLAYFQLLNDQAEVNKDLFNDKTGPGSRVVAELYISANGNTDVVHLVAYKQDYLLLAQMLNEWKFVPFIKDNKPVAVYTQLVLSFTGKKENSFR